jgi:hypothetical protein
MRNTITALLAIAAMAAAASSCLADDQAPEGLTPVPAQIFCRDGKPVGIRIIMSEPGLFTLQLPPDICAQHGESPGTTAPRPHAPASSPRTEV